jgi:hypothetical protein
LDEAAVQPALAGLEPTRVPTAVADAAPLPGLEPTRAPATAVTDAAPVPGLLPTAQESPAVAVESLPGLLTNEALLGALESEPAPAAPTGRCPRCQSDAGAESFCPRCGYRVRAIQPGTTPEVEPALVCLECSVPNPPGRVLCMACGKRLHARG